MRLWQADQWCLRSVTVSLGFTTRAGRVGARYYGLIWAGLPLVALFTNNSQRAPARSLGLATGPFELTLSMFIRDITRR